MCSLSLSLALSLWVGVGVGVRAHFCACGRVRWAGCVGGWVGGWVDVCLSMRVSLGSSCPTVPHVFLLKLLESV